LATATADRVNTGTDTGRPWLAALLYVAVLGSFFFLSYGFANTAASRRAYVPFVEFAWEQKVPFLAWTIIPYWTSDFLYAASILICTTRRELNMHAGRLIAAQLISVSCFLAFPLQCVFERPATHGFFGWWFDVLMGFDKPFNQAPSLHVSLAVILWSRFSAHLKAPWMILMRAWLILVVLSTMTTYQHQFLDLPTGALAGLLAIALFPDRDVLTRRGQRLRLATFYLAGSALAAGIAFRFGGVCWILLWPTVAMLTVALIYLADRPSLFRQPLIRVILAPYTGAAWINSRCWTRSHSAAHEIVDGVWLGRVPWGRTNFRSVVSLSPELPIGVRIIPMLDLVDPTSLQLRDAVAAIEEGVDQRPTLVCCALGFSRSAAAIAAWMLATGRARSATEAFEVIRRKRPQIVPPDLAKVS
jgi:hypothetical protein